MVSDATEVNSLLEIVTSVIHVFYKGFNELSGLDANTWFSKNAPETELILRLTGLVEECVRGHELKNCTEPCKPRLQTVATRCDPQRVGFTAMAVVGCLFTSSTKRASSSSVCFLKPYAIDSPEFFSSTSFKPFLSPWLTLLTSLSIITCECKSALRRAMLQYLRRTRSQVMKKSRKMASCLSWAINS